MDPRPNEIATIACQPVVRREWVVYRGAQGDAFLLSERLIDPLTEKMVWSREPVAVRISYSISSNDPEIQMILITT
jgi:hypothetical protein